MPASRRVCTWIAASALLLVGQVLGGPFRSIGQAWAAAPVVQDAALASTPVERRIARLHAVLQITRDQEGAWRNFADTVRRNTARSTAVDEAWRTRGRGTDAVGNLGLYGAIADADAQNAHELVPPFRTLYAALTPSQKKTADGLVRHYIDQQTRQRP